jgi:LPS sulfotransferase NodH
MASNNIKTEIQHRIIETKNMIVGHLDYTKFIILGRSRTGSNFLRGLLNSHPQVVTYGEVFQNSHSLEWDHTNYLRSNKTQYLLNNEPITLIDKKIFRKYPRNILAVGFKLFYYHAQEYPWKSVWGYLQENQDIKILHMKRKNLLKTHLSRKVAVTTDRWVSTNDVSAVEKTITLDYQECLEDFIKTRHEESDADNLFRNHQRMDVIYEELSNDYQQKMIQIQSFLNVPNVEVLPKTFQQSKLPLSRAINNYHELKDRFKGSEWEVFFDD